MSHVELDGAEGGFTLMGDAATFSVDASEPGLLLVDGDRSSVVVMTTGRSRCRAQVQALDGAPATAPESWTDVVEISVSGGPVHLTGLTEFEDLLTVISDSEAHRLRISRRAASRRDELLFEVWPAPVEPMAVLRRAMDEPNPFEVLLATDETKVVWAATRAIGQLADRGRDALSGALTDITVVGEVHAKGPHALRRFVQSGGGWDGGYMSSSPTGVPKYAVGETVVSSCYTDGKGDGLSGTTRAICQTVRELDRKRAARKSWKWRGAHRDSRDFLLEDDAQVHLEIVEESATDVGPITRLRVTHRGIPVEFAAGMELYWAWQFRLFNVRGL